MHATSAPARELIRIEQHGAVLHLRLNRPAKRNALNDDLRGALFAALREAVAGANALVGLNPGSSDLHARRQILTEQLYELETTGQLTRRR